MLLNFVIFCIAIQTAAVFGIFFNSVQINKDINRMSHAFCDFVSKFSIMNVGMLPEGIDDDFLQDMTSRLDADDDDETKQ